MGGVYTAEGIDRVIRMAETVAGSAETLRRKPFLSMITCGISPLLLDAKYGAFMIQVAREGIPVAVPSEPLCGATSPVTLAGNLVVQNCDALINVMTVQLASPGTPVITGCVATSTDLRDLKYLGGSVESGLINAAGAQMAQYYGLPYYATAGISDTKTVDAQCGYESALNNLLVALAGANFIHDAAGLMEFAMTVCPEKYVVDNEIIGMAMRAVAGIRVNDETLAVDLIRKVGPGGHFISSRHTRRHMRGEHYAPALSDRDTREQWKSAGARTVLDRASEVVGDILNADASPHLAGEVLDRLRIDFKDIAWEHFPAGGTIDSHRRENQRHAPAGTKGA
jgi:trimethylamine--corrinoid protein Co-methyltransferase